MVITTFTDETIDTILLDQKTWFDTEFLKAEVTFEFPKIATASIESRNTFVNKDGRRIRGKPCSFSGGCFKRAQSGGLCKAHGGGARCTVDGCTKSSQGFGKCRTHGGGKRCQFDGCTKGTQRAGFCHLHGGVRTCREPDCNKKDRGNGKCIKHGGGPKHKSVASYLVK